MAPPRLSGRFVFIEETVAGRYGNEEDAPALVRDTQLMPDWPVLASANPLRKG